MRMLPVLVLFVLDTLWAQEPADSRGWLNQGVQAFRQAKYPDAVRAFQRAVDLEPAFVTARLYLATSYMQQYIPGAVSPENEQLAANARENFLKVLDADPGNKVAIASVASLSLNQKNWDEAQRWYGRMIAADPSDRDAFYSLGFITWSRWYPAYQQARVNLAMKPEDPGPIPNQAVRQDLKTRYWSVLDGGISNLRRALELYPQFEDAMSYMNLIIRERADLRDTPEEYAQDIAEADQWVQKALDVKRQKAGSLIQQSQTTPIYTEVAVPVRDAKLIRKVDPVYPPLALQAHISGTVRLNVIISKNGAVENLTVISGHPLLVPAAIEAVKQWMYQPTLQNGVPMIAFTQAEVDFDQNN